MIIKSAFLEPRAELSPPLAVEFNLDYTFHPLQGSAHLFSTGLGGVQCAQTLIGSLQRHPTVDCSDPRLTS